MLPSTLEDKSNANLGELPPVAGAYLLSDLSVPQALSASSLLDRAIAALPSIARISSAFSTLEAGLKELGWRSGRPDESLHMKLKALGKDFGELKENFERLCGQETIRTRELNDFTLSDQAIEKLRREKYFEYLGEAFRKDQGLAPDAEIELVHGSPEYNRASEAAKARWNEELAAAREEVDPALASELKKDILKTRRNGYVVLASISDKVLKAVAAASELVSRPDVSSKLVISKMLYNPDVVRSLQYLEKTVQFAKQCDAFVKKSNRT